MKKLILLFVIALNSISIAQTFELDQVEQIWRPRIRADFRYVAPTKYQDTSSKFSSTEQSIVFTFPIKTKLGADLKLDLSSLKLKDILKNSVSIKASQVMGSLKFGSKQVNTGLDSIKTRNLYYGYAGVFGLKLTKKYRIMFYSLNAGFNEEDKTINTMALRANGVIGQFHIRGLRKNYYYGVAASYGDGKFFPMPFFGGMQPAGSKGTINFTIPAQIYYQYKPNQKHAISTGLTLDGFRYGMQFKNERINFNYANVNMFANYRYKLSKTFGFRVQAGYNLVQRVVLTDIDIKKTRYPLQPGFYVEAGIFTVFGKNLFEQVTASINDSFLNF